ncbi:polysaccharide deacetylase family protein [Spiribacter insolitus]|uniref:Polysaccharide deacetylase family protein n=1 Tax=Spiribacter insolitus TaxID=3122417 RepID=A0ABV3TBI4_9GAMM
MASTQASTSTSDRRGRWLAAVTAGLLAAAALVPMARAQDEAQAEPGSVAPETLASVLMYHRVGNPDYPGTSVTREQFQAHLDYLDDNDFNIVPLGRVVEALQTREPLPDRTVAITFDDAYRSVREVAHPMLAARDWPYTVFVATEGVNAGYDGYLDWDQLREMASDGARFGNHSRSHAPLFVRDDDETRPQWRARIEDDLTAAQQRLAEELGDALYQSPPLLAYPYGEYSLELMDLAAEMGFVAFGQQSGAIGIHSNSLALPRYPMNERFAGLEGFALKVNSRALPVVDQQPLDPVRASVQAPRLTLTLDPLPEQTSAQLACYYQGERLLPEWLEEGVRFAVRGDTDLPLGRSRYNCTAPDGSGRYYWFSQLWIQGRGGT